MTRFAVSVTGLFLLCVGACAHVTDLDHVQAAFIEEARRQKHQKPHRPKCPPMLRDIDFKHYDMPMPGGGKTHAYADVRSYKDCCHLCQGTEGCGAFTWHDWTMIWSPHHCYLKTSEAPSGAHHRDGCHSGDMRESPEPPVEFGDNVASGEWVV
uniref:Apple domain-containing protein n=1 Tax=Noctiluca scintillans TaxID=2966 RepID=A0A7S1FG46_NOCSC|mmetsp:Transcript_58415/g.155420  ORF Transcript_58415/g.155420 Transcript_58415/m.155420 type:complete len:154 (+) Transcript_58415:63-524(+)|eukprot:CAMPEP_0194501738 /NCGR_PEP_ID=MMETSP0253-20130528/22935_1 /TAXON_ID=2966 /ORGANISM="Noctiluca scintillans" /LENGTH=153 /DNA_ID=CAMNT_0039343763 /DNA_START=53 /DNA_END=514 /DNA_ORIENTATION=+